MPNGQPFVDYYRILEVEPDCNARALETSYHLLAKMYHPDHGETADVARLTAVIDAYRALKDPELRAEYDLLYASATGYVFASQSDDGEPESAPLSDAEAHARILMLLYKRRREQALDAGVGRYFVQEALKCSDELVEFHLWYLKEKGFIATTEQGTMAITIEGVDHVIATSRTTMQEKLLLSNSSDSSPD